MLRLFSVVLLLVVATAVLFSQLDPLLKAGFFAACLAQTGRSLLFDTSFRSHLRVSTAGGFRGIAVANAVSGLLIAIGALRSGGPVGVLGAVAALCWSALWVWLFRRLAPSATKSRGSETMESKAS